MNTQYIEVGRVIRVGRGWVDVTVNQKVRRISVRPDLLIRAGTYLKIIDDHAVSLMPAHQQPASKQH
ncbi:MAG: hypothetical protein GYB65_16580 [Chloroflexi bacterium]|nr:hypothetical protein [Chloroflexota bacterium]